MKFELEREFKIVNLKRKKGKRNKRKYKRKCKNAGMGSLNRIRPI
jgi:hypothetical protein